MKSSPIFDTVQMAKVASNGFDLSHDVKMSFQMGNLTPVSCLEVIPGDSFTIATEQMLRLAPMLAPVMHKLKVYTHYFFVPNRIIWNNFEKFITNANNPDLPAAPYIYGNFDVKSLGDYFGLPTGEVLDWVSALPFAAYQKIFNDFYRDENLQPDLMADNWTLEDGDNAVNFSMLTAMRKRAWMKDYFTSALPWAQKGQPVSIPVGEFQDVDVYLVDPPASVGNPTIVDSAGIPQPNTGLEVNGGELAAVGVGPSWINPNGSLKANTETLSPDAITINNLRTAIRLQEFLERDARGGTRYTEQIYSHFGVRSDDARLQRPEYIGGGYQSMIFSEVLQTSVGTETDPSPTGTMAGHGLSMGVNKGFNYYAKEHGYIIGIMSVMPNTAYQQGIPRHFSKKDPLQYAFPSFANLGEQEILNREIYYKQADGVINDAVFGYTPRYAEYKYVPSRVAGNFRDNLNYWHMGRIFASRPNLNASFIEGDPTKRIFAVTDEDEDEIYAHVYNKIYSRRKLPIYGTPTL